MLSDASELLQAIKGAAKEAVDAGKPMQLVFGTVVGIDPLEVSVESRITLGTSQLFLTSSVREYEVDMSVSHTTESASGGNGDSAYASHVHGYVGRKTFTVHNALSVGETVLLLRMQGGQKFVILDRVVRA